MMMKRAVYSAKATTGALSLNSFVSRVILCVVVERGSCLQKNLRAPQHFAPSMDVYSLYRSGEYHYVVLLGSVCSPGRSFLCFCLSLAAIGRPSAAVMILRGASETASDPPYRIDLLECLHYISKDESFLEELQYWRMAVNTDAGDFESLRPWPDVRPEKHIPVSVFILAGAFVHPQSFAHTCLVDEQTCNWAKLKWRSAALFELVATGGCISSTQRALRRELEAQQMAMKMAGYKREDAMRNLEDFQSSLQCVSSLKFSAALLHLLGRSRESYTLCTHAISLITTLVHRYGQLPLTGLLRSELLTFVMLAARQIPRDVDIKPLNSLLHELVELGDSLFRLLRIHGTYNELASAPPARRSCFFTSCAAIYFAKARLALHHVQFGEGQPDKAGLIYPHEGMLETSRKYAIAAALRPLDDPHLYAMYEDLLWSLVLGGGVDLRVVWFFLVARNHFLHTLYFTIADSHGSERKSLVPLENGDEILDRLFDVCQVALDAMYPGEEILLPSVVVYKNKLLFCHKYLGAAPPKRLFMRDGTFLEDGHYDATSQINLQELIDSSREIARLWICTFRESHGSVPAEIERLLSADLHGLIRSLS